MLYDFEPLIVCSLEPFLQVKYIDSHLFSCTYRSVSRPPVNGADPANYETYRCS